MRLTADADPELWMPVTSTASPATGRQASARRRRAAVKLLQSHSNLAWAKAAGVEGKAMLWFIRRLIPRAIHASSGQMLVWACVPAPDQLVVTATIQPLTSQLRAARASLPMEYDDTELFRGLMGAGERLVLMAPSDPDVHPLINYTWDTGTHIVTVAAISSSPAPLGEFLPALDALARTVRIIDDSTAAPDVVRIDPA